MCWAVNNVFLNQFGLLPEASGDLDYMMSSKEPFYEFWVFGFVLFFVDNDCIILFFGETFL